MTRNRVDKQEFWNRFATSKINESHIDTILGKYKSEEFIHLIEKWDEDLGQKKVLKTDLHEEAFGEDQILFSLTGKNLHIFALDISEETVKKANVKKISRGFNHDYLSADVRNLPFKENVFDLILSTSTLDHFTTEEEFKKSLIELKRVLRPSGYMIITLNNKHNLNFYLMLQLERILGLKSYPIQFFHLKSLKRIFRDTGLHIQEANAVVHIISPINSILRILGMLINKSIVDKFAEVCVSFFKWLGNRKRSRFLTGWFIALKCVK